MGDSGDSAAPEGHPRPLRAIVVIVTLVALALQVSFLRHFYADDAFIVALYAENLVDHGELVFNLGERICAFTSPLHALLEVVLYAATGRTLLANRVLSIAVVALSYGFAVRRFRRSGISLLWLTGLVLLSPPVILWTFGGLDTPYLFALVLALVLLAEGRGPLDARRAVAASAVIGLCLVTRFDSVFFVAPAAASIWLRLRPRRWILLSAAACGAPLGAWLLFAFRYYHALLPTSYYTKTPELSIHRLSVGVGYLATWLVLSGSLLAVAVAVLPRRGEKNVLWERFVVGNGWIVCGLLLEMGYGLTASTVHMMFSFRFFVPFLPACAFLVAKSFEGVEAPLRSSSSTRSVGAFVLGSSLQVAFGWLLWEVSSNPAPFLGVEFATVGVRTHQVRFNDYLFRMADTIEAHWRLQEESRNRGPRVRVWAEGIWPYRARNGYYFGSLVSYRSVCKAESWSVMSDYVFAKTSDPRTKAWEQLPDTVWAPEKAGGFEPMAYYFNRHPRENRLPRYVNEPCR
jgi:hypothetical protein